MTTQWVLGWWNLIFIMPFGLGLLYLGLYTISGWTFGEADTDVGIDHVVDVHLDADGHMTFEHDAADADGQGDAEGHEAAGNSSGGSSLLHALSWLGVGRVPLSLVLMVMMLSWGAIGFSANRLMIDWPAPQSSLLAIGIAFIGSVLITRLVSAMVARFLPTTETYARRRHELLGTVAEALYPIDSKFGMACGRDAGGQPFQVACRTEEGLAPVAKGAHIKLVGYTARERLFTVVPAKGDGT
jgi:hypothetical protein